MSRWDLFLAFLPLFLAGFAVALIVGMVAGLPRPRRRKWFPWWMKPPSHPMCRCIMIPMAPPRVPR